MTYSLTWLPGVLRDAGLEVLEHPGWQTRGHDDMGAVQRALPSHLRPSAWSGRARAGTPAPGPGTDGNSHFIGVEAENTGDTTGPRAEAWPDVQMQAYARPRRNRRSPRHWRRDGRRPQHKEYTRPLGRKSDPSFDMVMSRAGVVRPVEKKADTGAAVVCAPVCYVATAGPDHIVSASARPRWVASPAHATCPSGRTNTAFGAATGPIAGSSQGPA